MALFLGQNPDAHYECECSSEIRKHKRFFQMMLVNYFPEMYEALQIFNRIGAQRRNAAAARSAALFCQFRQSRFRPLCAAISCG